MDHPQDGLHRRELLRWAALIAAGATVPRGALARMVSALPAGSASPSAPSLPAPWPVIQPLAPAAFLPGAPATRRVVLVVFGGGVRSRETIESGNVPNLLRIAEQGVVYPATRVENVGHYGAAMSIFTGVTENFGIRENDRSSHPTIFEYVRKGAGLGAADVWLSTSGSEQETNYAYGTDGRYGAGFGANLIGGEGLFNAELRDVIGGGHLGQADPAQDALLAKLRGAVRTPLAAQGRDGVANDPEAAARIESYILDELRGGTATITGLGANDAKALRVARNLLAIFRPRLLAVTLRAPDVAHGSFNDYVTVIRRNDEELGAVFDAIRRDPELRDSTALLVLPEFGRDRDLNLRRGLDHGDDSAELHKVALVGWGPDFRKGKVVAQEVASVDVCSTLGKMFGVATGTARGQALPGLFA